MCDEAPVPRLADLPPPYASRISPAEQPNAWDRFCTPSHVSQWLAWNVREDAWYRASDLQRIQDVIDNVDPALVGADLLLVCAAKLQSLRDLSSPELCHLPTGGVNHVIEGRLKSNYDLAPGSDWDDGSSSGETNPAPLHSSARIQVVPRPGRTRKWITFDSKSQAVPRVPDVVAQRLGLTWGPPDGAVFRIEVPLNRLIAAHAPVHIPTIFNQICYRPLSPDWRARPVREHQSDEPWGSARDMRTGGSGLPEVLADITPAPEMDVVRLGPLKEDWGVRHYLASGGPQ